MLLVGEKMLLYKRHEQGEKVPFFVVNSIDRSASKAVPSSAVSAAPGAPPLQGVRNRPTCGNQQTGGNGAGSDCGADAEGKVEGGASRAQRSAL